MDIQQLRYFVAAAETGSITGAARRCRVAQPSLSAQIKKLEAYLGVSLFDRQGRGVVPTAAGELLLPRARDLIEELGDIERSLKTDTDAGVGSLAVGAIPTIAPFVVPEIIARLRRVLPGCVVSVREDYTELLTEALVENSLDLALLSPPLTHELLELEEVGVEDLLLALPEGHPLTQEDTVGVRALRREPMIVLSDANCLGRQVSAYCSARDAVGSVVCETAQLVTQLELVRAGVGSALVPACAARASHVDGLVYKPLSRGGAHRTIAVARRRGRSMPVAVEQFVALAREVLG
ncbi:MAG: LysR family transcriptional regulator [Planctomycetota bacterium]